MEELNLQELLDEITKKYLGKTASTYTLRLMETDFSNRVSDWVFNQTGNLPTHTIRPQFSIEIQNSGLRAIVLEGYFVSPL